jgi:phosphatidate cytidylyltransferase
MPIADCFRDTAFPEESMLSINTTLFWVISSVFIALTGGTLVRIVALRSATADVIQSRLQSLRTWWILAVVVSIATYFQEPGVAVILGVAAVLSLREFIGLVGWEHLGKPTASVLLAIVPIYYSVVLFFEDAVVRQASPAVFILVIGGLRASLGNVQGYVRSTSAAIWGLMLFLYCLSHAFMLFEFSGKSEPTAGRVGWFLYLVLLTETNDIMQAIVGRRIGATKITPAISPNKSLEGLLGGMAVTILLAVLTAPVLTGLMHGRSTLAGGRSARSDLHCRRAATGAVEWCLAGFHADG